MNNIIASKVITIYKQNFCQLMKQALEICSSLTFLSYRLVYFSVSRLKPVL